MDNEFRIKYYCGSYYNKKITLVVNPKYKDFKINQVYFYQGPDFYKNKDENFYPYFWFPDSNFHIDFPCLAISSDGIDNEKLPVIMKARKINSENKGFLLKLQAPRHWEPINWVKDNDVDWSEKNNKIIWRGNHTCGSWKKPNRIMLVEKYNKTHNIKFYPIEKNEYYYKNPQLFDTKQTSMKEQLKNKYIIIMEGNDVASGLKWALKSNSLVIMPKPQIESWLMEDQLEPWKHYVPINNDLDDLEEKINWCNNHDDNCYEISKNSSKYMNIFTNHINEKKIFNEIKSIYQKNIVLK